MRRDSLTGRGRVPRVSATLVTTNHNLQVSYSENWLAGINSQLPQVHLYLSLAGAHPNHLEGSASRKFWLFQRPIPGLVEC